MKSCPFCRETASSPRIIEMLYDFYPSSSGHRLLVPTRHVARVADLTGAEMIGMIWSAQRIIQELDADGFTVGINDGTAAGQTIHHVHMHVIPRDVGDVPDPRGGIRWVLPSTADYWTQT